MMESEENQFPSSAPRSHICARGSLSEDSSSSSNSKHRMKRNRSSNPNLFLHVLHVSYDVSDWKRQNAERCLHIFYNTDYITNNMEILKKVKIPAEDLTEEQLKYISFINEHFTLDRPVNSFKRGLGTVVQNELADIVKRVNDLQQSSELALQPWIFSLKDFLFATTVFCNCLRDIGKNQETLYEGVFREFASEFARLCHLRVQSCCKVHNVVMENLKGKKISSKPDLCFFKSGFNHDLHFTSIISVTEAKPDVDDIYVQPKKRHKRSHRQSSSDSLRASSSDSSRASSSEECKQPIALDLHDKVLGQHAGQLLLDLHNKYKNEDLSGQERDLFVLGMIINGTTIYFTLLQISSKHYQKLCENVPLCDEDKAMIYYSVGRDILLIKERNLLIEDLLHLNNIEL